MYSRLLRVGLILLILFGFIFTACEEAIKNATEQDITIETEVFDGEVAGDSSATTLAKGVRIGGEGALLTKSMLVEYIEVPILVPNVSLLTAVLRAGGSFITGTLTNELATAAVFTLYFSDVTGLTDPQSAAFQASATMIASITFSGNETVVITQNGGFDQDNLTISNNMAAFVAANPGIQTVYAYMVADGDPTVKILIETMDLWLPPSWHFLKVIEPGSFSDYSENLREIKDGELSGTITNTSAQAVEFSFYVSLVDAGYVSGDPPQSDLVAHAIIAAGATLDLANESEYMQPGGSAILQDAITNLVAGETHELNLFFISQGGALMSLQLNAVELHTALTVGL